MNHRRLLAPALALMLSAAVGGGIWYSSRQASAERADQAALQAQLARQVSLRGLIGSEKEAYFADARVQQALAQRGIQVTVDKAGSRSIAGRYDPKAYDFGFPAGAPAGAQLRQLAKAPAVFSPFYTPMVVASWKPIADILAANGIVKVEQGIHYLVDLPKLMSLIEQGKRWRDLQGNSTFATGKAVLIHSTDVRSSNSAAMYLALASYLANGQQIVQSAEEVEQVLPRVAPLFLRQGLQEPSSAGPFEDYLALGMGKAPLLMAYESQLVEYLLRHPDRRKTDMVMLYPRPTVYSKHVLVPYTAAGARLGQALETDPTLRQLAHEYGFRTGGDAKGVELWRERGIQVPETLIDVIDPPSHEWLERMIVAIEARFN